MTYPFGKSKQYVITHTFDQHIKAGGVQARYAGVDVRMHRKEEGILAPENGKVVNFYDDVYVGGKKYVALCTHLISTDGKRIHEFVHLGKWLVKSGTKVIEGRKIAIPGKTGYVFTQYDNLTHYALYVPRGNRVDPQKFFNSIKPPISPKARYKLVGRVNLRSGPGLKYKPIVVVPYGAVVARVNKVVKSASGYHWYRVKYKSFDGWMATNWMKAI